MFITINKNLCIGCGACAVLCPDNFRIGSDGKAEVLNQSDNECVKKAVVNCSAQAIKD